MKTKTIVVVGLIAVCAIILFLFNPAVSNLYPTCALNKFTGLYCPGCGTQRAAHEILHGNIYEAFSLNALFTVSLPFGIYHIFIEIFNKLAKTNVRNIQLSTRNLIVLVILAVVFMILRNLDFPPFNWLAP